MPHEFLVKRIICVAKCDNDECPDPLEKEWINNPPREIQCPSCRKWVKPHEISYTGPEIGLSGRR